MTTLIVTGAKKRTSRAGIATSIFLHSAIIIGAIVGTAHVVRPAPEKIEEHVLLYEAPKQPDPPPLPPKNADPKKVHVAPPKAPPAPPKPQVARYVAPKAAKSAPVLTAPTRVAVTLPPANPTAAPITEVAPAPVADPGPPAKADNGGSDRAGKAGGTGDADAKASTETFNEDQVEKVVQRLPGAPSPRYPDSMKGAGITGEVQMRYIVGTNGRVESGSIEVISSPNKAFSDAVRTALLGTRFRPAEVGGRPVRQLVEQSFSFKLEN